MTEVNDPLVSAVVPTFNRAPRVVRAIDSVLRQTHSAIEVIVIDDGSTDDTAAVLADRYGDDHRVRVFRQENRGVAPARNRGLDEAQGDFVALLDSDDEWEPWKLELQLACLDAYPDAGMIWTDMAAVDADGALIADRYIRRMYRAFRALDLGATFTSSRSLEGLGAPSGDGRLWFGDVFREMLGGNLVHTSTVLMTRRRLETVGRFDESLRVTGEDYDFHLRTCRAGPVAFADAPSITYRVGAPDQLNRDELMVPLARNYLRTIEKALTVPDPRIDRRLARAARASGHALLGEELLEVGLTSEGRSHLWSSLVRRPTLRVAGLAALSLMPPQAVPALRRAWRALRAPFWRRSGR